ncbi:MAG: disulfide isomerase DsbC N-terminal domain-containing protein [Aeromonas sp.]
MQYLLLGMMLLCAFAANAGMDPQLLKQTITNRLGVPVYMVNQTPIPGLYQLGTARGVLYSDANGDYVIQGVMLDITQDMQNLTVAGMKQQRSLGLSQVVHPPLVKKAPNERYRVALFLSEHDAERRNLSASLQQLQTLGITVELFPVIESTVQAAGWCSDPLLQNEPFKRYLPEQQCSETLIQNIGLSQWLGVKVLPAWVSSDGNLIRGYQSPDQLLKILSQYAEAPANTSSSAS